VRRAGAARPRAGVVSEEAGMDDAYCLFVTVSCMLTLMLPSAAQPLFALLVFGLALTALTGAPPAHPTRSAYPHRGGVHDGP
jgi:hypothetical protein